MKHYHKNPRTITKKQFADLQDSLRRLGDLSGIVHDLTTDEIVGGNQRMEVFDINSAQIEITEKMDQPDEQGTVARGWVYWQGKKYTYRAVVWDEKTREEANIRANKAGGSWDFDTLANEFEVGELLEWGFSEKELQIGGFDFGGANRGDKPNPRNLPIDAIFSIISPPRCCIAADAGFLIGGQSSRTMKECPVGHKISFIDNDYFKYDHQVHAECVKRFSPKYATVRDAMTEGQCVSENISYYQLEQIIDWAEELSGYAENVIVIPKFDCLDKIPEKFMLGYSIPTKHGGTPLPAEAFKGRRVHLLGGSWTDMLAYMSILSDNVVSFDNNYENRKAEFGEFTDPEGKYHHIDKDLPWDRTNGLMASLVLGLGAIGAKVNQLYSGNGKPGEE